MKLVIRSVLGLALAILAFPATAFGSLVHQWRCNETSGTTLFDSVGTAHGLITTATTNFTDTIAGPVTPGITNRYFRVKIVPP